MHHLIWSLNNSVTYKLQSRQHIEKQRHYFTNKSLSSQRHGFSSRHVWMWELEYKESWAPKNWCFWTVVLEKTLESPLDCKEIQPVNPKGNQSWKSLEGLMLKSKLQYFGHLIWRTDSLEKTLMLGKIEAGGEGDNRGWEVWMASLTWWTWIWVGSGSWWWTGKPGVLQSMGSQRVGHNWVTELNLQVSKWVKVVQLCLTFYDPTDYAVHGILQAGMLEWGAFPFSRGSSQPRDQTQVSCIAGGFFTSWVTREAQLTSSIWKWHSATKQLHLSMLWFWVLGMPVF